MGEKRARLWRRYSDLRAKCQKTESTFNDAKLLPEAKLSHEHASVAMTNAARDLQMFLRSTKF